MRKLINKLLVVMLLSIIFVPIQVKAAGDNVYVVDDGNLLTVDERTEIRNFLQEQDDGINYVVVTSETNTYGSDPDSILAHYYTSKYSNYDDGIAFIIDMYHREIYIEGFGDVQKKIGNADALDITDNAYRYASRGDYYQCIMKAMNQSATLVNGGFILRPMRFIAAFLLSILLGFLGTFFVAMQQRSKMDFGKDASSQIIMTGAAIVGSAVIYDTKRIHRAQSSGHSSGGFSGGGGGGFSGGGFSGGGGGHSSGGHSGGGHSF